MPILECLQAWAELKTQEFGQRHGEVRMAVRIDRELRDVELFVPDEASMAAPA